MGRIVAFDWDDACLRCILADRTGQTLVVGAAKSVPLSPEPPQDHAARLGNALRQALAKETTKRATVLVAVPRASVELLQLTLPPATDTELPELVLNQVLRESPNATDDAVVDFVALTDDSKEPRRVTAAILPADELARIRAVCAHAGLRADRILLRPHASASLAARLAPPTNGGFLLLSCVGDEVDLSVFVGRSIVLSRTVRLPVGLDETRRADRLVGEARRTITALPPEMGSETPVEGLMLFGKPGQNASLVERIRSDLALSVDVIDPFRAVEIAEEVAIADPGPFASLLGMSLDEVQDASRAIDFLHPRKPHSPPNRRRLVGLAAAVVTVLALIGGYHVWSSLAEIDAENAALASRLAELKKPVAQAAKQKELIDAIHNWQNRNVNWLDELRDLSLRFPPAHDALVLRMTMTGARTGGGAVEWEGMVRDPSVVVRMETNLRDEFHDVRSRRVQERVQEKIHTWLFEASMVVATRTKDQYISQLPLPVQHNDESLPDASERAESPRDVSP